MTTTDIKKLRTLEQQAWHDLKGHIADLYMRLLMSNIEKKPAVLLPTDSPSRWTKEYDALSKLVDTHAERSQPVLSGAFAEAVALLAKHACFYGEPNSAVDKAAKLLEAALSELDALRSAKVCSTCNGGAPGISRDTQHCPECKAPPSEGGERMSEVKP